MYCLQETVHFLHGVGYQYRLEVITVLQTATDTGGNGVHVFQYRTVFYAGYVIADGCFDK